MGGGNQYVVVDGGTNGQIEAPNAGSSGRREAGVGIYMQNCSHCTVQDLEIGPLYNRTDDSDESVDQVYGIYIRDDSDVTVQNNYLHDANWEVEMFADDDTTTWSKNMVFSHNQCARFNICFDVHQSGGTVGPWTFDHNHMHDTCNWDDTAGGNAYHHNPLHAFGGSHITGFYYYDNLMDGCFGVTSTSTGIFIEGHGDSPAFDSTSPVYVFNNVVLNTGGSGSGPGEGVWSESTGDEHTFNNTVVTQSAPGQPNVFGCWQGQQSDQPTYCTIENNVSVITGGGGNQIDYRYATLRSNQPDYNVYQGSGSAVEAPVQPSGCGSGFNFATQFAAYKSCMQAETHSVVTTNMNLASDGSPQPGSPAIRAGANLTSLCVGPLVPLCSDIDGAPRPTSGAWNAGAFG